ncbi:MAG: cation transporter [Promethearchaeota archaeon]|nr:MAG: cation transporter [Candidatus Lokiarchaeota archaeon]
MKKENKIDQIFEYRDVAKKRLILSLTITLTVMFVEIFGGIISNSVALLSDASHMFTHAFAISISLFAIYLAQKPACHHKTFGLYRAEVLSAFINGLFLFVIVGFILYEAIMRFLNPIEIDSIYMFVVALIGLSVNIASVLLLHGSQKGNLNVKGVFYHMIGDAASSIGIVFVSIMIFFTNWFFLDPIISFIISGLIIYWAYGILKDSGRILLEMTPSGLNIDMIEKDLKAKFEKEIETVEHTHLWTITPQILVITTHVRLKKGIDNDDFISRANDYLFEKYEISESTIEVRYSEEVRSCNI